MYITGPGQLPKKRVWNMKYWKVAFEIQQTNLSCDADYVWLCNYIPDWRLCCFTVPGWPARQFRGQFCSRLKCGLSWWNAYRLSCNNSVLSYYVAVATSHFPCEGMLTVAAKHGSWTEIDMCYQATGKGHAYWPTRVTWLRNSDESREVWAARGVRCTYSMDSALYIAHVIHDNHYHV